jgi:predicted ATPase
MPIREISVSNFKSFRELRIEPDNFNIVIGSNASGKSNLIQIFKFLRDIAKYGLNNAISLQGGVEYLRNTNIGAQEPLTFRILYLLDEKREDVIGLKETLPVTFEPYEVLYEFALTFAEQGEGYEITRDLLVITGTFALPGVSGENTRGMGSLSLSRSDDSISYQVTPPNQMNLRDEEIFPNYFQRHPAPP